MAYMLLELSLLPSLKKIATGVAKHARLDNINAFDSCFLVFHLYLFSAAKVTIKIGKA
jgi:hypothetical protein